MSFDFKLMFAWHGSMMALMVFGSSVPIAMGVVVAGMLAVCLALVSTMHRRAVDWHWRGIRPANIAAAVFYAIAIGLFLFAATPLFPPVNTATLAWYLAGGGIGVFQILAALNVTRLSEADFLADSGPQDPASELASVQAVPEPLWKRATRAIFMTAFLLVWADGVASFYFFGTAFRDGSPVANSGKSERLVNHGAVAYVSASDKKFVDGLQTVMVFGIPTVMICAALIHFVLGVKLLPNVPSLAEIRQRGS